MELIEKKSAPIKTKVQFSKKEWDKMPDIIKAQYKKGAEKHETAKNVYFIFDGDLINPRKEV